MASFGDALQMGHQVGLQPMVIAPGYEAPIVAAKNKLSFSFFDYMQQCSYAVVHMHVSDAADH